jgi:DNA-binding FrmR family transcriptional regulator
MTVPSTIKKSTVVPPDDKKRLLARLARVEGQLRGIQKMISEDEECEKIAQQIGAARGALNKAFADQISCAVSRTLAGYSCDTEIIRNEVREILLLLTKYG